MVTNVTLFRVLEYGLCPTNYALVSYPSVPLLSTLTHSQLETTPEQNSRQKR